jgi:pyruvate dehydrogenase E2 component (dihydrolipoamide acetyltransferase)
VVAAFLDRLGEERVELVGHSFGGAVAARVACLRPNRLHRLTLLAPVGLDRAIDVEFIRGIVRVSSGGALAHLLRRLVVRPAALTPAQLATLAAELGRGRLSALAESLVDESGQQVDITGNLRALSMPVRVVWGLQDRIIPWIQAKEAGSRCAIHLIADAGHVPHWDQPAEVAALFN